MEEKLCIVCGAEPTKLAPYTSLNICDNLACHVGVVENIITPQETEQITGDVCQKL